MSDEIESTVPPWEEKKQTLLRLEADTDYSYGLRPESREINELIRLGIINLDKHRGPTSHDVASTVRKILGVERVGNGGTLARISGKSCRLRHSATADRRCY